MFNLKKKSKKSQARLGLLKTEHGDIQTPFFMPIATQGAVKNLISQELLKLGCQIILANSYHLYFKPGLNTLRRAGGLHSLIHWPRPILTDSGGFQVFSLAHKFFQNNFNYKDNRSLVKITREGVYFQSVYDGSRHLFTPEKVLRIQEILHSDIQMVLDICSPSKCSKDKARRDLEKTLFWAERSRRNKTKNKSLLFGIVQGALFEDLRKYCAEKLVRLNFDGYAIGGLAVGETVKEMYQVLDYSTPLLPEDKPRYLMGVGYPEQIIEAVSRGVDMFDCVIPTREARHGRLYFFNPKFKTQHLKDRFKNKNFYKTINITLEKFSRDLSSINPDSDISELREYSKAYLRHLFSVNEPLAMRLATLNNLEFYLNLMERIRENIKSDKL